MAGTVEDVAVSVDRNAARVTSLLRAGLDANQNVRGSEWTIGQLGALSRAVGARTRTWRTAPRARTSISTCEPRPARDVSKLTPAATCVTWLT